jgi:uncharacterized protein (TIGR03437 family)
VQNTGIPSVLIGNTDGKALKAFLTNNANSSVTVDPAYSAADNSKVNTVATYSARGPSVGNFAATRDFALKPELVAPGTNIYTATQKLDLNSDAYNATGYTTVNGTSYAVPFVAGVAAMAKAKNSNLNSPARLKSAVVNTASTTDLQGDSHVTDVGAGKLNAADAINVAATLDPAAISFGPIITVPVNRTLTVTNVSSASATFTITVRQLTSDSNARVTVTPSSVTVPAGQSQQITVSLTGSKPAAGPYEGFLDVKGPTGTPDLHLPYFYVVGSGVPYDIFPMQNGSFIGVPNDFGYLLLFRVVDPYGVPVVNTPVSFQILAGGKFNTQGGDKVTDALGTAGVFVDLGSQQGPQTFSGTAGGLTQIFDGFARRLPTIKSGGVVNAAPPYAAGQGLQPGSYISIFGSDLADATVVESTSSLPLSLVGCRELRRAAKSARYPLINPGQISIQIHGNSGTIIRQNEVTLYGYLWSDVYTVPLATYSPGIFAVTDGGNNLPISASNPAKRGGSIVIYANGLGPVSVTQTSGEPSSSTQLVGTNTAPTVTIGGSTGGIIFSGLTPGFVGLYQVNVSIPTDAPTGTQPLKLSIGGQDTTLSLVVQ